LVSRLILRLVSRLVSRSAAHSIRPFDLPGPCMKLCLSSVSFSAPVAAAAIALAGVWTVVATGAAHAQDSATSSPADTVANAASFQACVDALRRERPQHPEVRAETFDQYTRGVTDIRPVIQAATESQPEFKLAIWDYVARLVDEDRIAQGKEILQTQAAPLRAIAARRGVDPATAVAVFGVETDYGRVGGRYRVVDATLSRACLDLKSKERKKHFYAALWLLQEGLVQPDAFRGSWAGAFGLTQFMPGTFVAFMDDGDGSGKADIVNSAPDALATTANYISSLGWTDGLRWGVEVAPPKGPAADLVAGERDHACLSGGDAIGKCRTIEQWIAMGVAAVDAKDGASGSLAALPKGTRAALLAPGGNDGPAWLVTRNYQAVWQYNRADAYALSIGLLSDALRGDPPMQTAWPTDDIGLSRSGMRQLQQSLLQHGHTDVVADGYDGPKTREAIRQEEKQRGWPETGRAGQRIARAVKADAVAATRDSQQPVAPDAAASAPSSAVSDVPLPQPAASSPATN
jgi:lytic murein transglycosylase